LHLIAIICGLTAKFVGQLLKVGKMS
jgi:hypothetical protein